MTDQRIDAADKLQRFRLRSLRAVEDMIEAVVQALAETGRLERTYIVFTSDNGLLMGQHRAVAPQGQPLRGVRRHPPDRPRARRTASAAPTPSPSPSTSPRPCSSWPASRVPESVDGRSLAAVPPGRAAGRAGATDALLENHGAGPTYSLRTTEWMYNHQDTEEFELYDMRTDPFQLKNLYRTADPALLDSLRERLAALVACRGASCRS